MRGTGASGGRARFDDRLLDDIRARIDVSDVVGERVQWDRRKSKAGKGDHWACCPFHEEKTPSFHADDRRGRYHCFGCKKSGDIFTFLTETRGLTFPEAVVELAGRAGVDLPKPDAQSEKLEERKSRLRACLEEACKFYEAQLKDGGDGAAKAVGYLKSRGITGETAKRFRLGYAPAKGGVLAAHMKAAGYTPDDLVQAGMLKQDKDSDDT